MIAWLRNLLFRKSPEAPDSGYPEYDFCDRIPEDFPANDTQPTRPGLLDSLPLKDDDDVR